MEIGLDQTKVKTTQSNGFKKDTNIKRSEARNSGGLQILQIPGFLYRIAQTTAVLPRL